MKLRTLFLMVFLLIASVQVQAQDDGVVDVQPITAENASELQMLAQYGDGVFTGTLAWAPDGSRLAVGGTLGVWLYDGHNLIASPELLSTPAEVHDLSFSPDGRTLAFYSYGTIYLYNLAERSFSLTLHDTYYYAFSPDGHWLAYAKYKNMARGQYNPVWTIYLLDLQQGDSFTLLELRNQDSIQNITFSPDSAQLAISWLWQDYLTCETEGAYTQVWDVVLGQRDMRSINIPDAQYAYYNSDGSLIASVERISGMGNIGRVQLWDTQRNEQRFLLDGSDDPDVWAYTANPVFHPIHPLVAFTADAYPTDLVQLWNTQSGERMAQVQANAEIRGLAYTPDGRSLVGVTRDALYIWDGEQLTQTGVVARPRTMNDIRVNDVGTEFVYNDNAGFLHYWSFEHLEQFVSNEPTSPESLHFSEQGNGLAFMDEHGVIHVWRGSTETLLNGTFDIVPTFSADNSLAAYLNEGQVEIWNTNIGEQQAVVERRLTAEVRIQFTPDNAMLLTVDDDRNDGSVVALWDASNGTAIAHLGTFTGSMSVRFNDDSTRLSIINSYWMQVSENNRYRRIEARSFDLTYTRYSTFDTNFFITNDAWRYGDFSPDMSMFYFNASDWSSLDLHFVDVDSGQETFSAYNSYPGGISGFSPDGNRMLIHVNSVTNCGGDYQETTLWNVPEQRQIGTVATGNTAFSPDSQLLVVASWDTTIWDANTGVRLARRLGNLSRAAYSAMFSADNRRLITISDEGIVRVWGVPVD